MFKVEIITRFIGIMHMFGLSCYNLFLPLLQTRSDSAASVTEPDPRTTRSKNPHVRLGWKHMKENGYKQVYFKDGGGIRHIQTESLNLDVDELINLGVLAFFSEGKCKFGQLREMEMFISDCQGNRICTFEDGKGNRCCYGDYLKARGLFSSKYTLYLTTKNSPSVTTAAFVEDPEESEEPEATDEAGQTMAECEMDLGDVMEGTMDAAHPHVHIAEMGRPAAMTQGIRQVDTNASVDAMLLPTINGKVLERQELAVAYVLEQHSVYSSNTIHMKCHSIAQCKDVASFENPDVSNELGRAFKPWENGFSVLSITAGGKAYLELDFNETENGTLIRNVPSTEDVNGVPGVIVNHPCEIWGYDDSTMLIGVVTAYQHAREETTYMWFKDDELVDNDPGTCLLVVEEAGIYQCIVTFGNVTEASNPIAIISVTEATESSAHTEPEAQPPNRDNPEQDQAAQAPASVDQIESPCVSVPEVLVDELNIDTAMTLGQGSFGTVRRGHWAGSDVAVKTIRIPKRGKGQMLRMIVSEVGISARLRHPNIVQFLAIAKEPSAVHLVNEYIDGYNMEEAIFDDEAKNDMAIGPHDKLYISRQCMQGVAYMHTIKPMVIHRDIKPGNIMIKRGCYTTKLCDLGISRVKSMVAATTTVFGKVGGSPAYMAPETMLHSAKSSCATDVWSLGITLLELFYERDAWLSDGELDPVGHIKGKMVKEISPLSLALEDAVVPVEVVTFLEKCICYDASKRPTVVDMLQAFDLPR